MADLPEHLRYAPTHEWVALEDDTIVRVGITDFAQQALGDLVYLQLPEVGRKVSAGEQCAVVESVKTASDLFSPVTGTVISFNELLLDEPEQVNENPYQAWLFCIKADNPIELNTLMSASEYQAKQED
jgi:glycine cleavage system H protein